MLKHLPPPLPTLLSLLSLFTLSSSYVCFPPFGPLPTYHDCITLMNALDILSHQPDADIAKHWGRHVPTTAHSENLPRWYYVEEELQPPTTCAVVVDVDGMELSYVETFSLRDVVEAAHIAFFECLVERAQIGLDFPAEWGHVYAKMMRMDGRPLARLGRGAGGGSRRRVVLPDKKVLNIVSGARLIEGIARGNLSETR
ncbi:MAG: hypothetical protein Q9178_003705 [Gyalolechia marmorata]